MKIIGSFDEDLSPRIVLSLAGKQISLVVDTGFNGELMLPRTLVEELGLAYSMKSEAELADGSIVETTLYQVRIHWFGEERALQAIVTEAEDGLIGTEMLFGLTLFIDIDENQVVLESKANPHTEAANRPI